MTHVRERSMTVRSMLAVSAIALTAVLGTPGAQAADVADLVQDAEQYRAEGRVAESIIQLKNALQQEPTHAGANALLGRVYLDAGDAARAEVQLVRARDLGASAEEWVVPLMRAWLALGRNRDVLALDADMPPSLSPTLRADARALAGRAHAGLEDAAAAEQAFEESVAMANSALGRAGLAGIALLNGNTETARREAEAALAAAPDQPDVVTIAAEVALRSGDPARAEALLRELIAEYPVNPGLRLSLAQALLVQDRNQDAADTLDDVMRQVSGVPQAHRMRAMAAFRLDDIARADSEISRALSLAPDDRQARMLAGLVKYRQGEMQQAANLLETFGDEPGVPANVRAALASALLQVGRGVEAAETAEPLTSFAEGNAEILNLLGAAALASGQPEVARERLEAALQLAPDNPQTLRNLAEARQRTGDTDGALEAIGKVAAQDWTDMVVVGTYFAMLMSEKRVEEAQAVAEKVRAAQPGESTADTMLGLAALAGGDRAAAEESFRAALAQRPGDPDAARNLANLLLMQGEKQEARDILTDALETGGAEPRILMTLADIARSDGDVEAERAWLERAVQSGGPSVQARERLATLLLGQQRYEAALATIVPALRAQPDGPGVLRVTAAARLGSGDVAGALEAVRRLAEVAPGPDSYRLLADAAARAGDGPLMREALADLVEAEPENVEARAALVETLLARTDTMEEARPHVDAGLAMAPDDERFIAADGRLRLRADAVAGRAWLEEQVDPRAGTVPPRPLVIMLALFDRPADPAGARERLDAWLQAYPHDHAAALVLSGWEIEDELWSDAEATLRRVVAGLPQNWAARNNLAWVLLHRGETTDALEQVKIARAAVGDRPELLDTEARIRLAMGDAAAAEPLFRQAVLSGAQPANDYKMGLAESLVAQRKAPEARSLLESVLATDPDTPTAEKVQNLLASLPEEGE